MPDCARDETSAPQSNQDKIPGNPSRATAHSSVRLVLGPPSHRFLDNPFITVHLDGISSEGRLSGWIVDLSTPNQPASVLVSVDGAVLGSVLSDLERPDVVASGAATFPCGFEFDLPLHVFDGKPHVLEVRETAGTALGLFLDDEIARSCIFSGTISARSPIIRSHVEGIEGGIITGWVLRGGLGSATLRGGCEVLVTCRGTEVSRVRADRARVDVATHMTADVNCGFQIAIPEGIERAGRPRFRLFVLPEMQELDGSPLQVSFLPERERTILDSLVGEIDRLHVELTQLRRRAHAALPRDTYTLDTYDAWARRYFPALRRRVRIAQDERAPRPLISVVMPVYRPLVADFLAAVRSVQSQTYEHWELIIVDDASGRADLSLHLAALASGDGRIRVLTHRENGGISRATNTGIDAAAGEWVAFLDHDDALVDVALQAMLQAAQASGARVLYSDEDKVDAEGTFSDPAFKPDWNHRLLLGVNYVCHLLMVERETLRAIGPLDPRLDGAQDHDMVLRLSEHVPPASIHHVPEVLYHWRKTPNSTAVATSNKPYASLAGIRAVSGHLARLGRPATVTNLQGSTFYRVAWRTEHAPRVAVIIPYRDRIAMTRECVMRVLDLTGYPEYELILVDNWSVSAEAEAFAAEMAALPRVRVMRVEEEFNYSRLNNAAMEQTDAPFVVFMNNDLFVEQRDWLRILVNEAVVDHEVGAVGGKFVYPDRTVQHGGVVIGVGGVAGHVHSHLAEDDPGYGARAILPQQLSAVTAAAMLVRTEAFHAAGGFDERDLTVAFNDIDLCLKIGAAGYRIVWTPDFIAEHRESISRGRDDHPGKESRVFHEVQTMIERWGSTLRSDPFYSQWLSLEGSPFHALADPTGP